MRTPETTAALVNTGLILLAPTAVYVAISIVSALGFFDRGNTVTAYVTPATTRALQAAVTVLRMTIALLPFAAIAGWRTWVHARRYLAGTGTGLQGILEAGWLGFLDMLFGLRNSIMTRTSEAPAYIIAYGGMAFVIGLVCGAVLWSTAMLTLKLARPQLFSS
jgi:hypothetical protein